MALLSRVEKSVEVELRSFWSWAVEVLADKLSVGVVLVLAGAELDVWELELFDEFRVDR